MDHIYDLVIIGGGINGCGCAADAAMRGLSVLLCEQGDLASKTSSSSSKLIHGGLRYLEQYDFGLVKKALDEQQILLEMAPHLVHPMSFVLPHASSGRSHWLVRAGLFLYDHLSVQNTLPNSRAITRESDPSYFVPLLDGIHDAFVYYDCWADDARLTLMNALQAHTHGANILPRTACTHAQVIDRIWHLTLKKEDGATDIVRARALINAAGPWVHEVNRVLNLPMTQQMSFVKGSHIVLNQMYAGEHAYVLEQEDKRIVFVMPYYGKTLIGTTEVEWHNVMTPPSISADETAYLCQIATQYFKCSIHSNQVQSVLSGLRPLLSDESKSVSALSRDYRYELIHHPAPVVSVYGGKMTTYRKLSEQVVDSLESVFPRLKKTVTHKQPLPGAVDQGLEFKAYQTYAAQRYHWLNRPTLKRYLMTYGTRTEYILRGMNCEQDLGHCFMPTLYEAEVAYLVTHEWVMSVEDLLWRRTKLGLYATEAQRVEMEHYLFEKDLRTGLHSR